MQIYGIHSYIICAYSQSPFRSISVILQEHIYQTEKLLHNLKFTQDSVYSGSGWKCGVLWYSQATIAFAKVKYWFSVKPCMPNTLSNFSIKWKRTTYSILSQVIISRFCKLAVSVTIRANTLNNFWSINSIHYTVMEEVQQSIKTKNSKSSGTNNVLNQNPTYVIESTSPLKCGKVPSSYRQLGSTGIVAVTTGTWWNQTNKEAA